MSRYLKFKKSFEEIVDRDATHTEKMLLCALSLIRRAYDENHKEFVACKKYICSKHGSLFLKNAGLMTNDENRRDILYHMDDENKKIDIMRLYRLHHLEQQFYAVSKQVRRGLGLEMKEEDIPKDINKKLEEMGKDTLKSRYAPRRRKEVLQ